MSDFSHCRHASCCQCGAKAGTPEHDADCMSARIGHAINKASEGRTRRKLTAREKKAQP